MSSNKITLIMAMLVLAVFALGSVSAAENVTADIDVPTEEIEIDDSVVKEVEIDDVTEDADVDDNSGNIRSSDIHVNSSMDLDSIQTAINTAESGSTIYFDSGIYTDISLTLNKSNVIYSGYGATLIGTGTNHIFNLPNNMDNFTIQGFTLNVNNVTGKSSAVYGSFITNGVIKDNTMYNGANGININKYYDNITIGNNIIHDMNNDGISLANPITNSNITNLGNTYISDNSIQSCAYGIFIGGNFKGNITSNYVALCNWGIQIVGKPNNYTGCINATIYDNGFDFVSTGIDIQNTTINHLNISRNIIYTPSTLHFTILFDGNNSDILGYFGIVDNDLHGSIYNSLVNMAYFTNNRYYTIIYDD